MNSLKTCVCRAGFGLLTGFALSAGAYTATYTLDENVTISDAGDYLVTGTGSGMVAVAPNIAGVTITCSNVTATVANAGSSFLKLNTETTVRLVLLGDSTVTSAGGIGIAIPETAALTVEGPGSLTLQSVYESCVGGGGGARMGTLTLNGGRIVATCGVLEGWVDHADATCFGNATGPGTAQANAADAGLTVTGGTVLWNHLRTTEETGFAYAFSNCSVGCSGAPEALPVGLWLPIATDLETFFGANVVFEKKAGETVALDAAHFALADLAKGNVTLTDESPFTLVGSSASSANKIVATAGEQVEAGVCGVASTGCWEVPANSSVTLWVYGGNTITVGGICYKLPDTGALILKGTGAWTLESALNSLSASIGNVGGNWGRLEVDGPTIEAIGGDRGAGVGGSYSFGGTGSGGGEVIVRSGTLIARGWGAAPGIGGGAPYKGKCGSGPQVTVYTNGTLYAYNMPGSRGSDYANASSGVAIGAARPTMDSAAGFAADSAGTITVDGGTLYASAGNETVSCFGCPGSNAYSTFVQKDAATGALTVKNGGKVFFNHATFPEAMTVTIDDGTLGTCADSPAQTWVTFLAGQATVTNRLTIAGAVETTLLSVPTFLNHPALVCDVPVNLGVAMGTDEWVVPGGLYELTAVVGYRLKNRQVGDEIWTRCDVEDGWIHLDETNTCYTIQANGVYKFMGTGATGATAIRVEPGVICTNVFNNVTLAVSSGGVAPLELGANAQVTLQLLRDSALSRADGDSCAVIRVPETAALVIEDGSDDATGSLTINQQAIAQKHVVGIGNAGGGCKSGAVTVNSGKLTVQMNHTGVTHGGAAIGTAGQNTTFGSYTQNGGEVTLDGPGLGPAIGGGTDNTTCGSAGSVLITGGTLTAHGYGGASAIGLAPTYGSGTVGRAGTYRQTGGTVWARAYAQGSYSAGQCGAAIGGSGTRGGSTSSSMGRIEISGGALYAWSEKSYSFGCGKPQNAAVPSLAATDALVITGGSVWAPQGAQGPAVNALGQPIQAWSVPISTLSGDATTVDLGGDLTYTFSNVNLGNGYAYPWLPTGAVTIGGRDYVQGLDRPLTFAFDGARLTYLAGQVVLTTGNTLVKGVGGLAANTASALVLSNFLYQATAKTGFNGTIGLGGKVSMQLVGTNTVQSCVDMAAIYLPQGAELTISGGADDWLKIDETVAKTGSTVGIGAGGNSTISMGTLTLDSGNVEIVMSKTSTGSSGAAVGIGNGNRTAGKVVVNGGYLYADGGALAAGIGGGYNNGSQAGHGGIVEVNGGVVVAKGYGGSAGIGGATAYRGGAGNGGTFLQRGGSVTAYALNEGMWASGNVGAAIGGGARRDGTGWTGAAGTITVSNGTLTVSADNGAAAIGFGSPVGGIKGYNGTTAKFTIAGGSVKMASYNVAPSNGTEAVTLAQFPAARAGHAPYDVTVTRAPNDGWSYRYTGAGHADDDQLYFYLTEGRYRLDAKFFTFMNGKVEFPGLTVILR